MERYRGTRDFLPENWEIEKYLFEKWRKISLLYGFQEYEAPIIEHVELFTKKSGEEIKEQLFWFKDKSKRDVCLRAELTPQLARYIVSYGAKYKKPIKWFSIPRLFRYERPQKGRLREFFQYNADIVGDSSIKNTIEIISLAMDILKEFKINFKFKVGSRQAVEEIIKKYKIKDKGKFYQLLDKRYKLGEDEFKKELKKFSLKEIPKVETERLKQIKGFFGNKIEVDLSIVRGLQYYTDIVFEAYDKKGKYRAILGGGEYSNLIKSFGGPNLPAVGFGMGDAVILEILKEKGILPKKENKLIFIATIGNTFKKAYEIATKLRKKGIRTYLNTTDQSLKKQMALASDIAKYVIIVGEKELKENIITIRNMETGKENKIKISKLYNLKLNI